MRVSRLALFLLVHFLFLLSLVSIITWTSFLFGEINLYFFSNVSFDLCHNGLFIELGVYCSRLRGSSFYHITSKTSLCSFFYICFPIEYWLSRIQIQIPSFDYFERSFTRFNNRSCFIRNIELSQDWFLNSGPLAALRRISLILSASSSLVFK